MIDLERYSRYLVETGQAPLWCKAYFDPDSTPELIQLALALDTFISMKKHCLVPQRVEDVPPTAENLNIAFAAADFDKYIRRITQC